MIESEGLRIVRIMQGKHRKIVVTAPPDHRAEHLIVASVSSCSRRGLLNLRSTVRKIVRRSVNNKRFT